MLPVARANDSGSVRLVVVSEGCGALVDHPVERSLKGKRPSLPSAEL